MLVEYIETTFVSADYCSEASVEERFNADGCNSEEPEELKEPPVMSKSQKTSKAKTGKSSKYSRRNRALRG